MYIYAGPAMELGTVIGCIHFLPVSCGAVYCNCPCLCVCKQKQRGLRGLLRSWPCITEWEVHITGQPLPSVSEMTYTVLSGTVNPRFSGGCM